MKTTKTAIFPGSFDPVTKAHLAIVERGLSLFDHVIIGVGVNSSKKGMFSLSDRLLMLEKAIEPYQNRVSVQQFEGLTVDFCKKSHAKFILRGMRSPKDFEFESAIAQNNKELDPTIESVFLISENALSHISSTITREIISNDGTITHLVPPSVTDLIASKRTS